VLSATTEVDLVQISQIKFAAIYRRRMVRCSSPRRDAGQWWNTMVLLCEDSAQDCDSSWLRSEHFRRRSL